MCRDQAAGEGLPETDKCLKKKWEEILSLLFGLSGKRKRSGTSTGRGGETKKEEGGGQKSAQDGQDGSEKREMKLVLIATRRIPETLPGGPPGRGDKELVIGKCVKVGSAQLHDR